MQVDKTTLERIESFTNMLLVLECQIGADKAEILEIILVMSMILQSNLDATITADIHDRALTIYNAMVGKIGDT